jgi:FG-GAP repeat protein
VGDFNGDGLPDLAVVNAFQGVVTVLDNTVHEGQEGTTHEGRGGKTHEEQEGPSSSSGPITPTPPPVTYPTVPTRAQILESLAQQPRPLGDWAGLRPPVKGKSYAFPFKALEAGTAAVDWYALPPARRHAWDAHTKPVLVASGKLTFLAAATETMRIGSTKAGLVLLKRAARLRLTVREAFTPTGSTTPITVVRTVVLEIHRAR